MKYGYVSNKINNLNKYTKTIIASKFLQEDIIVKEILKFIQS